jgi:hypothetical protein
MGRSDSKHLTVRQRVAAEGKRRCNTCQKELEDTAINFATTEMCVYCYQRDQAQRTNNDILRVVAAADKVQMARLEMWSRGALPFEQAPNVIEHLENLLALAGGSQGFAQRIWTEFLSAPPGGMIRQQYIRMVNEMINRAHEEGKTTDHVTKMTNEELEKASESLMEEVIGRITREAVTVDDDEL